MNTHLGPVNHKCSRNLRAHDYIKSANNHIRGLGITHCFANSTTAPCYEDDLALDVEEVWDSEGRHDRDRERFPTLQNACTIMYQAGAPNSKTLSSIPC
jgi:hypothetical protein